jgi:uncharacterized glyoxalase superfamily protein PhnB
MGIAVRGICPLIEVFDMPTSIRFYRDVLGFEVAMSAPPDREGDDWGWALLRLGEAELMLNTAYDEGERPAAPDPARAGAHRDTTLFFGCADVDGAYRHLREHGLDVSHPEVQSYGMKQLTLTDPDGYGLCFQWPVDTGEATGATDDDNPF